MNRRALIGGAAGVGATGVVVAVLVLSGGDRDATESAPAGPRQPTTTIERRDLVETETVDGSLGFVDSRTTYGTLSGTLTWAPAVGEVVRTGERLYRVDGTSVFLFDGAVPAYRALGEGSRGTDVMQVQRTLRDLGDDPSDAITVNGTWDAATTEALRRWQRDRGLDETGRLELGTFAFAPGARRVTALASDVGAQLGGGGGSAGGGAAGGGATGASAPGGSAVLTTTSTRRIVAVDLGASEQRLADRRSGVRVTLPDDRVVRGRIVRVGRVARTVANAGEDADPTIKVTIRLLGDPRTRLDQAPVDVELARDRASDALTVPVTALLSQQGGGFAVEVHEGAARRIVGVTVGLSTDSMVEITGSGLRSGMVVSNSAV